MHADANQDTTRNTTPNSTISRRRVGAAAAAALLWLPARRSLAAVQPFAGRNIRVVVPYAAGGVADTTARICIENVAVALGAAALVVDNKPGAGGNIGAEHVARQPADGGTFLVGPSSLITTNPYVPQLRLKDMDITKALVSVGALADTLLTLVVHSGIHINTLQQFIDRAKTGEPLRVGNAGTGTPHHLAALLLERALGVSFIHVAYKGGAPMVADLSGGHIDAALSTVTVAGPLVASGRLKYIGLAQPQPSPALPGVPSLAPVLQGAVIPTWAGMYAPTGTPAPLLDAMNAALLDAVRSPATAARLRDNGLEPLAWTRPEMEAKMAAEADFMKQFLARVKLDFAS